MTTDSTTRAETLPVAQIVAGIAIGSAVAWVFVPTSAGGLVIALIIPLVAAYTGLRGGRLMGDVTAVVAGLWFGYLHTEPRFSVVIASRADVILTLAVLVVSVLASELADARHRLKQASK